MANANPAINCIIIDCVDPERLAAFWSELLGRSIAGRTGPYVWLEREGGLGMGFQKIAEPKTGKNRLHLDLASADPAAEQRRIESLGGRRLQEYASGGFLVMADLEGNEFCVIPSGPFELDDEGRTNYLDDVSR
jgi:predicted enzyme related to lactoylglutathione lyase